MFPGRTQEQKAKLAEAFTKAFVEIGKAKPEAVDIIFVEVQRGDWANGGKLSE
jgi:4-oxalocrotonate tautomerase family enzyme